MGRLTGKVAILTASTEGIGFAIARKLVGEGAKVVVSSRKKTNVDAAISKLEDFGHKDNISGIVCHVGKSEDRKKLYDEAVSIGGIDILISCAGVNPFFGFAADCPEKAWDKIFEINVRCAFLLTKEVLPYLKERNGGSIIYITSIAGLQPFQIYERTESEVSHDTVLTQIPMNRFGEPNDVEGVTAFLCSEDANYVTGEIIAVSGGMRSRL